MKSGNLNFLEPSGSLQACNGTALPLPMYINVLLNYSQDQNVRDKSCTEIKTQFLVSNFSNENRAVYEITLENTVKSEIFRIRFAYWITKATDIHSEYVIKVK